MRTERNLSQLHGKVAVITGGSSGSGLRAWLAVASIGIVTFAMVTTELLPIGLLSPIARDLGVSDGVGGLMVMTTGLVSALSAPLSMLVAGRTDRRTVIVLLTALILASDAVVAAAPDFPTVLFGRVLIGVSVGAVWTFAVAIGRRLVPEAQGGRATAIILAGISGGMVLGVPAGALIGHAWGWRAAFVAGGVLAALGLAAQLVLLPRLPVERGVRARDLVDILFVRQARVGLLAAALVAAGQFIAYTYLEPFLSQESGIPPASLGLVLVAYGVGGFVGNFAGERAMAWNIRLAFSGTAVLLAISIVGSAMLGHSPMMAAVLVTAWGFVFGAVPVCVQIWLYQSAPERFEVGSSMMVLVFQIALALGALSGGVIVDHAGIDSAFIAGGVLSIASAAVILAFGGKRAAAPPLDSPIGTTLEQSAGAIE